MNRDIDSFAASVARYREAAREASKKGTGAGRFRRFQKMAQRRPWREKRQGMMQEMMQEMEDPMAVSLTKTERHRKGRSRSFTAVWQRAWAGKAFFQKRRQGTGLKDWKAVAMI